MKKPLIYQKEQKGGQTVNEEAPHLPKRAKMSPDGK